MVVYPAPYPRTRANTCASHLIVFAHKATQLFAERSNLVAQERRGALCCLEPLAQQLVIFRRQDQVIEETANERRSFETQRLRIRQSGQLRSKFH